MADSQMNVKGNSTTSTMGQILWRLVTSAVVLAITAFFTPGFSINNLWTLAIAAIVLSIMDYVITKFTGLHASSFGRGIVGFALAVATLYATQFLYNILDGSNNWCFNLWSCRLFYSRYSKCIILE